MIFFCLKMDWRCLFLNVIITSALLVFVLLFYYSRTWKQKSKSPREIRRFSSLNTSESGIRGSGINGESTDVIIVGAGVAGSALAWALAKDGWHVRIIERDLTAPKRIAGEYLLPGGCLNLVELGLEDCVNGIDAQSSPGYVFYKNGKEIHAPFPLKSFHSEISGKCFHNGLFILRLREKAASLPNVKLEQGTVTSLLEEKGTIKGVRYKTKAGQDLAACAPLTIVCDGCFSNLRRFLCSPQVETPSCFVGLILENCNLPHGSNGHIILSDKPVIFYPISRNEVRCLVDVPAQNLPSISNGEMVNYLRTVVAPQIPTELYNAFISSVDGGNIKIMPNRMMPESSNPTPGALLLGDALNMRHPLTGGGMTVALSDVIILRDLLRPLHDLSDAATLCEYLESFHTLRKPMASVINTLADTLHKIFSTSSDPARKEMSQACFEYLGVGGVFSNGFVALMGGLNPRPWSLIFHLFALMVYGVGRLLLPFPSPKRIWIAAALVLDAMGMILPMMKAEGLRQMLLCVPAYYKAPPDSGHLNEKEN